MLPKFKDALSYEQAEILMQPTFIRVIDNIRKRTEINNLDISYEEINEPFPNYLLCLKKGDDIIKYDLWKICFQICFINYQDDQDNLVEIDTNLFDHNYQLDWQKLDDKTITIVTKILG